MLGETEKTSDVCRTELGLPHVFRQRIRLERVCISVSDMGSVSLPGELVRLRDGVFDGGRPRVEVSVHDADSGDAPGEDRRTARIRP